MMFQDKAPLFGRMRTWPRRTKVRSGRQLTSLKAMGASLVSRLTYAAVSRLDGIGKCAIGDMICSALRSSVGNGETLYPDTRLSPLLRVGASPGRAVFDSLGEARTTSFMVIIRL